MQKLCMFKTKKYLFLDQVLFSGKKLSDFMLKQPNHYSLLCREM